jgi:hypothetical protein
LLSPTPLYNLAILEDIALVTQHKILTKTLHAAPVLAKALMLFKVSCLALRDPCFCFCFCA